MRSVIEFVKRYSWVYASILIAVLLAYYYLGRLPFDTDTILYGLILFSQQTGFYVVLLVGLSFLVFMAFLLAIDKKLLKLRQQIVLSATLLVLFGTVLFSCFANIRLFTEFGDSFVHLDRVTVGEHLYQLALVHNFWFREGNYYLYQCDNIGISCSRVQSWDTSRNPAYYTDSPGIGLTEVKLELDAQSNTLTINTPTEELFAYKL